MPKTPSPLCGAVSTNPWVPSYYYTHDDDIFYVYLNTRKAKIRAGNLMQIPLPSGALEVAPHRTSHPLRFLRPFMSTLTQDIQPKRPTVGKNTRGEKKRASMGDDEMSLGVDLHAQY